MGENVNQELLKLSDPMTGVKSMLFYRLPGNSQTEIRDIIVAEHCYTMLPKMAGLTFER